MHMIQQLMLLYKGNAGSKGHKQGSVPEHGVFDGVIDEPSIPGSPKRRNGNTPEPALLVVELKKFPNASASRIWIF